jgi:imidazolonepropionase-like amidohydrolase
MQLISLKADHNTTNLILHGGSGAHLVATHLANSSIPVILTRNRGAPDSYEKRSSLPGPPLSASPASVLSKAGVKYALAIPGDNDSHIHNLVLEASWAAKYAGLEKREAVKLVSRNVEEILGLRHSEGFVVWDGDPMEFGASVVLGTEGDGVGVCWPESN